MTGVLGLFAAAATVPLIFIQHLLSHCAPTKTHSNLLLRGAAAVGPARCSILVASSFVFVFRSLRYLTKSVQEHPDRDLGLVHVLVSSVKMISVGCYRYQLERGAQTVCDKRWASRRGQAGSSASGIRPFAARYNPR